MRRALAVLLIVAASAAEAQEQYLCIGTRATGFRWNGDQWTNTTFTAEHEKYVVQEIAELKIGNETFNFEVKRLGEHLAFNCRRTKTSSRISCGGPAIGMVIDTKRLRFIHHYLFGYLDEDSNADNPFISIGTCTRLK